MNNIKAVFVGCVFIIIVILVVQLMYIFVAVGYTELAKLYPFLNDISGVFRYLIGLPVFIAVMFVGGYITAVIVGERDNDKASENGSINVWPHCIAVGLITAGGMLFSAMQYSRLTMTGIIIFILAIIATTVGGQYWKKRNKAHMI